jgi:hypothetical protein
MGRTYVTIGVTKTNSGETNRDKVTSIYAPPALAITDHDNAIRLLSRIGSVAGNRFVFAQNTRRATG